MDKNRKRRIEKNPKIDKFLRFFAADRKVCESKVVCGIAHSLARNRSTALVAQAPIAFFDSGVGGLTVYKEVKKLLPSENYLYFGDTENMPYGEKTKEELVEIARKIFDFFAKRSVKAVVMACNTTSATVYDKLKNDYDFKIYPIIQSVAKIFAEFPISRLGVFATPATINSHAYSHEINKINAGMMIKEIACPEWVRIVEDNKVYQPQTILQVREKMDEMGDFEPEKIILGCTHYPYLSEVLGQFYDVKNLIDPSKYFAKFIADDLGDLLNENGGSEKFFVSSNPENFRTAAKLFYELNELPELVKL